MAVKEKNNLESEKKTRLLKVSFDVRLKDEIFEFDNIEEAIAFLEVNPHCYWAIAGFGKGTYFGTSLMIDELRSKL